MCLLLLPNSGKLPKYPTPLALTNTFLECELHSKLIGSLLPHTGLCLPLPGSSVEFERRSLHPGYGFSLSWLRWLSPCPLTKRLVSWAPLYEKSPQEGREGLDSSLSVWYTQRRALKIPSFIHETSEYQPQGDQGGQADQCCKATSSFPPCWEGCSGGRRTQKSGVRAPSKVMWIWIEISAPTSSRARNELLSSYQSGGHWIRSTRHSNSRRWWLMFRGGLGVQNWVKTQSSFPPRAVWFGTSTELYPW